jgi:hypothetical protein
LNTKLAYKRKLEVIDSWLKAAKKLFVHHSDINPKLAKLIGKGLMVVQMAGYANKNLYDAWTDALRLKKLE